MVKESIFEVSFSMLPDNKNQIAYKNYFMLEDNINFDIFNIINWDGGPAKIMFVILVFCTKGNIHIRCNLQDFVIRTNDLFILPPGSIVDSAHNDTDSKIGVMYLADYNREYLPKGTTRVQLMSEILYNPYVIHLSEEAMFHVRNCYQMIRRVITDEKMDKKDDAISGYMQVMASYTTACLDENLQQPSEIKMNRNEQIFHQFVELVRQNYQMHREVTFYADKMCISPKYLGVVVTRVSGRRPIDWIRDYVILDAKAMILSGKYPIQQISDSLHFANPSFFGKYFKEAVGCSPGKYRKK